MSQSEGTTEGAPAPEAIAKPETEAPETSKPAEVSKQYVASSSSSTSVVVQPNYDDWKEMETQIDQGDLYNAKGESIQMLFNGKVSVAKPEEKRRSLFSFKQLLGRSTESIPEESSERSEFGTNYTRVAMEKQATKFMTVDKSYDFLFQNENDNLKKMHQGEERQLEKVPESDEESMSSFSDVEEAFENFEKQDTGKEMTVNNQLLTTKSMLSDSQKIAYAALVKLTIVEQHMKLNEIECSGATKVMKKLAASQKAFTRWSINVMDELYSHLGITDHQERQMIENLSCHGIGPADLVSFFDTSLTVHSKLTENDGMIRDGNSELLDIDIRWTLLCDLFLILLEASVYDARSRKLMLQFAELLGIKHLEVYQFERRITGALEMDEIITIASSNQKGWNDRDLLKEHKKRGRGKKLVKIAFATVAGGLVIGLSAGALAPVIGAGVAAGLSTIGITGTAGIFGGTVGTTAITAGGVLTGMKIGEEGMASRVGSVRTFEFQPLHNNGRLNLIITISGWMAGQTDDVRLPFSTVDPVMGDLYSLLWEPDMLTSMGQTIEILANEILTQSIQQILGATILVTLMGAIQLPMWLSKLSYLIDNPWNVSLNRADYSGHILADTLRRRSLGIRPVTLVGFSIGSKVIATCLQDLAKTGDYGIVENVYMFGAPVVYDEDSVALARSVVSGRFVNGYSKQDWILGYLFRATSGGLRSVAGISPIAGIENVDCTSEVKGHMEYRHMMPKLLRQLGWEVVSDEFVDMQQPDEKASERQRKLVHDFEKAREMGTHKKTWYNKLFRKKDKEWWEMYDEGMKDTTVEEEEEHGGEKEKKDPALFDIKALEREVSKIEAEARKRKRQSKAPPELTKSGLRTFNMSPTSNSSSRSHFSPQSKGHSRNRSSDSTLSSGFNFNVVASPQPELRQFALVDSPSRSKHMSGSSLQSFRSLNLDVVQTSPREPSGGSRGSKGSRDSGMNSRRHSRRQSSILSTTGIDYDDEDEFPHDESNIKISFA